MGRFTAFSRAKILSKKGQFNGGIFDRERL